MDTQSIDQPPRSPAAAFLLFICFVLVWGVSWPLTKIGLQRIDPMWFIALRLILGAGSLMLYAWYKGVLAWPKRQDIPILLSVSIVQEVLYFFLAAEGLVVETVSRASLLVYSTPFWVMPLSVLIFKEKLTKIKVAGFFLGMAGFVVLFNPLAFDWSNHRVIVSNGLLLLSSLCWAVGILHTKYGKWASPMLLLVAWQGTIAAAVFTVYAACTAPFPAWRSIWSSIGPLVYTGLLSSGLGAVVGFTVTRHLPVAITSISLLAVPLVGIISSAIWLDEPIEKASLFASAFILLGIGCIAFPGKGKSLPAKGGPVPAAENEPSPD